MTLLTALYVCFFVDLHDSMGGLKWFKIIQNNDKLNFIEFIRYWIIIGLVILVKFSMYIDRFYKID